jgi:hypothetical protein
LFDYLRVPFRVIRGPALHAAVLLAVAMVAAGCSSAGGPRVDGALPKHAPAKAQTFVMIEGDGFAPNALVRVGSNSLQGLTWVNARLLTGVVAELQPGSYDVTVENPGGGTATLARAFTVDGAAPGQAATSTPQPTGAGTAPPATVPPSATLSPPPTQRPIERPTQRPTERPTQQATRVPTEQPTRVATEQPTRQPPRPTPAQPQNRPQQTPDLSGEWLITDTVSYGPGTGSSFPFDLSLTQQGSQLSGGGNGLQLSGVIDGATVSASYSQSNGTTGTFSWTAGADGNTLAGSFTNSSGNGGDSVGQRLGSGVILDVQHAPPADAAPHGGGKGKKKGR